MPPSTSQDVYYRAAKEFGYRARSAFKLLQIDRHFHLLSPGTAPLTAVDSAAQRFTFALPAAAPWPCLSASLIPALASPGRVIDLCAAPGGWSEVVSATLCPPPLLSLAAAEAAPMVIAVDVASMAPLPGVSIVQGDLTHASTVQALLRLLQPHRASLVLCDAAPDVVHQEDVDGFVQHSLLLSALQLCAHALAPGGAFVGKVFRGAEVHRVLARCAAFFDDVAVAKPRASRNSSAEAFVVCRGYRGHTAGEDAEECGEECGEEGAEAEAGADGPSLRPRWRFVSCGDEADLDADQTYPLSFRIPGAPPTSAAAAPLTPTALPIDPPYQTALRLQRQRRRRRPQSADDKRGEGTK